MLIRVEKDGRLWYKMKAQRVILMAESLHTLILPRSDMSTTRQQIAAVFITLTTLVMAGLVSNLEAALTKPFYTSQASPTVTATAPVGTAAQVAIDKAEIQILRNSISFFWVAGGAVLGAYVGVAIRKVTGRNNIAINISVSLATSLAITPWLLKNHVNGEPETCFMFGFLVAVGAWLAWELVLLIGERLRKAARDRGWIGVKQEIFGGSGQMSVTIPPPPAIQSPPHKV